jgi:hypothetical protein
MPKGLAWSCALLVVSTSAFAQPKATSAPPEPSLWDHNGSVVSLIAQGSAREFHYKEPRPGILDAGARPGAVLFRGKVMNGQYSGAAFMFDRRCGQISYAVSGPILDNDQRVVLTGEAPLLGAKCRVQGYFTEVLEFRLKNANWTARAVAPESAPPPSLETEERVAPPVPAPPALPRETQPASPNPPAVIAELVPVQKQAPAPPAPPSAPNPPAAVTDHAPTQKQFAAPPPPPPTPNPTAVVADHAPAQKQAAAPPAAPSAAKPELAAEIERTRAAREQAAAAAEAVRAAELAAHRAFAQAEATRAAAEARLQQTRDDLQAARDEHSEGRFRQTLILLAMSWTLLLSGVTIVLLIIKLRRSRSPGQAENPKTADVSAAMTFDLPLYSRWSQIAAKADAANAAKSHGYQSGGRTRVFFQTRPAQQSGNAPHLGRAGYSPR